ncbi:MAG: hypothetical protein AAB676_13515 [Verrucomicrobiota bacterium]
MAITWQQPPPRVKSGRRAGAWAAPTAARPLTGACWILERKNPRAREDLTHLPPTQLAADILKKEQRIAELMGNIGKLLAKNGA